MSNQILEYVLFAILAIIIFIVSVFSEISDFIDSFSPIAERVCDYKGDSIVALGEHKFLVRSTLRGAYIDRNGISATKMERRQKPYWKICPTASNNEFNRKHFSIYAPIRSELTETHLPFAADITVTLQKGTPARSDLYEGRNVTRAGDWKSSGDFHTRIHTFTGIGGGGAWSVRLFVANDEKFVTRGGNPVAFQCSVGGKSKRDIKRCMTFFAWSDDLRVSYAFNDQDYPIEEWRILHGQVIDYIKSISLPVDPEPKNSMKRP